MSEVIEGIKLIAHNASGVNEPDDPSYPWLLVANLRPPEFMSVAFIFMHGGSETIRVRGMTKEALEDFATLNGLRNHPRLQSLTIIKAEQDS